MKKLRSDSAE